MKFPKPKQIVSKKIRNAAKGSHCTLRIPGVCCGNVETVVACHLNSAQKGWANKSPDLFTVFACHTCHGWLDDETAADPYRVDRFREIVRALIETQTKLLNLNIIQVQ